MGCIASKDVGLAEVNVAERATATILVRQRRSNVENKWRLASVVIGAMAMSAKCWAANDLLMLKRYIREADLFHNNVAAALV